MKYADDANDALNSCATVPISPSREYLGLFKQIYLLEEISPFCGKKQFAFTMALWDIEQNIYIPIKLAIKVTHI